MATERQIQAARANGAKSRGPKTPEGKTRSSLNSMKHGLWAKDIVLSCEKESDFEMTRDEYCAELQPQTRSELDLVDELVAARWRLERVWAMQSALLNHEIDTRRHLVESTPPDAAALTEACLAFRSLVDNSHALDLLHRYEARFSRTVARVLEYFRKRRAERTPAPPPEPEPPQIAERTQDAPADPAVSTFSEPSETDPPDPRPSATPDNLVPLRGSPGRTPRMDR